MKTRVRTKKRVIVRYMEGNACSHIELSTHEPGVQLSQTVIENIFGDDRFTNMAGVFWYLDLKLYAGYDDSFLIGFGEDRGIHEHDRWLGVISGKTGDRRWRGIDLDLLPLMDKRSSVMNRKTVEDLPLMEFKTKLCNFSRQVEKVRNQYPDSPLSSSEVIVSSLIPYAIGPTALLNLENTNLKELHDIAYHPEAFTRKNPISPPTTRFSCVPSMESTHGEKLQPEKSLKLFLDMLSPNPIE